MIEHIRYVGPLVTDTSIPGERKADGIIPAHPGCVQASPQRWIVFVATLDPRGCDATRSILYQLRKDAPDGPLVKEGLMAAADDDWDPLQRGDRLRKGCGMPVAFGVPKGQTYQGQPLPNENVFAVKWYCRGFLRRGADLLPLSVVPKPGGFPSANDVLLAGTRVEWLQFRLNDLEDGIEVLQPAQLLHQEGYRADTVFCSIEAARSMNHSMVPPIPIDPQCSEWAEFDTFNMAADGGIPTTAAALRYVFDQKTGLYQWTQTGLPVNLPGPSVAEPSMARSGQDWVVAFRGSGRDGGNTYWFRAPDPFEDLGEPTTTPCSATPRHLYTCSDGVLRLFTNRRTERWRDVLCCWDVDPVDLVLTNEQVVFDAQERFLPFSDSGADMSKLCPWQEHRQLVLFRLITRKQTSSVRPGPRVTAQEHAAAGVHYAEITYR